jgi:hypothetical protein
MYISFNIEYYKWEAQYYKWEPLVGEGPRPRLYLCVKGECQEARQQNLDDSSEPTGKTELKMAI